LGERREEDGGRLFKSPGALTRSRPSPRAGAPNEGGLKGAMWRIEPSENPDWDYARNKQVLLKSPMAEFSASAFTAPIEIGGRRFYGGNRDSQWQGLLIGPINGVIYKAIDAIYFSIPGLELRAREVLIGPGECEYRYHCDALEVSHRISLNGSIGEVALGASVGRPCWFAVLADPRPAEDRGEGLYEAEPGPERLVIKPSNAPFRMIVEGFDMAEPSGMRLQWRYKLGDGFRRMDSGAVKFVGDSRTVSIPFLLFSKGGSLRIRVPIPNGARGDWAPRAGIEGARFGEGPVAEALALRLRNLASFSMHLDGGWFPEAGAWWFRRPWVRDALEGLRWNLGAYQFLGWGDRVASLLDRLLDTLRSLRGLPIVMGAKKFASDAVPQLLNVVWRTADALGDRGLLLKGIESASLVAEELLEGRAISDTALLDSILCCPADSSWIDSVVDIEGRPWPARLPMAWADEGIDPFSMEYGLVEVNALYIEALEGLAAASERFGVRAPRAIGELLGILRDGSDAFFKAHGTPPLAISPPHGLVDRTFGSPAVVAASALRGRLSGGAIANIWGEVSRRLLVHRRLVALGDGRFPFGILAREAGPVPYLGDREYHGPTIWPRDTPYLLELMEAVGEDVIGLLLNNLDHMVSEGAIGYCNELFSLPIGGNPSAGPESSNPVPVKNPAQYWSHWCDPFLERLPGLLGAGSRA